MPGRLKRLLVIVACGTGLVIPVRPATAQSTRADSLEQWIRRAYALESPGSREVWQELGWTGAGFGFRSFAARRPSSGESAAQTMKLMETMMEYFRLHLDEVHTQVDGDVGLAWGVHTEVFKIRGQPAESVRVRFTNTLRWNGTTWKNLLFHRDAQAFDETGRYIRKPQ
jgi:hypothetical protein